MKLYQKLINQLKKEPTLTDESGQLKKQVVLEKARELDEKLIDLLSQDDEIKSEFFKPVKDVVSFNQSKSISFLEYKNWGLYAKQHDFLSYLLIILGKLINIYLPKPPKLRQNQSYVIGSRG